MIVSKDIILSLDDVTRTFGGVKALTNVSIEIEKGKITGIIGPNGAGKTTTFNLITGAYTPSSGSIHFRGQCLEGKKPFQIARLGIARTFQNIRLFSSMTVWEHLLVSQRSSGANFDRFSPFSSKRSLAFRQAEKALEAFGLTAHRERIANSLPYGLQRKVEMARALTTDPHLLLLDEPIAGMIHEEADELRHLLKALCRDGLTILLIEHDMNFVMKLCDNLHVLDFGRLIASGMPGEIRTNPVVLDAYLGSES